MNLGSIVQYYLFILYGLSIFFSVILFINTMRSPKLGYLFLPILVAQFYPIFALFKFFEHFSMIYSILLVFLLFFGLLSVFLILLISRKSIKEPINKFILYQKISISMYFSMWLFLLPYPVLFFTEHFLLSAYLFIFSILPLIVIFNPTKNTKRNILILTIIGVITYFIFKDFKIYSGINILLLILVSLLFLSFYLFIYSCKRRENSTAIKIWIPRAILVLNFLICFIFFSINYFLKIYAACQPQL